MNPVTLEEAQAKLPEIVGRLQPGEEVIILRHSQPVARIVAAEKKVRKPREPGTAKGKILFMADDFDAPLEEFREYME